MLTFTPEHVQHLMDRTNCGVPLRDLYQTTVSGLAGVTEHCHFIAQISYCWLRFHIRHLHLSSGYSPFLLEFKDSSSPDAWHDEEGMIVQMVRGVVLLGERHGDALNQTMSPWRAAP